MVEKNHVAWHENKNHKGNKYGCIWRHDTVTKGREACDHKYNAFNASKGRSDMHGRDFRMTARILGYIDLNNKLTGKAGGEIASHAMKENKNETWYKKYFKRHKTSIYWLSKDSKAWTVDYAIPGVAFKHYGNSKTFVPKAQDGPGAWFPYHHNAHHLIPQGAFKEFVIYGEGDVEPVKRIEMVLASEWNINNEKNMVILPQELQVSAICCLPAHCPYGVPHHNEYSHSCKEELNEVRKQIDKAVSTEKCEDIKKIILELDEVSESMLDKIKTMEVGKKIGT